MKTKNILSKIFAIAIIVIFGIIVVNNIICFFVANINYNYNKKVWQEYDYDGIIYDQFDFEKLHYGLGNLAEKGCGAVAVYDILKLENFNPDFVEVIRYFDYVGENGLGLAGTKISSIIRYLKKYGAKISTTTYKYQFKDLATTSKYALHVYFGVYEGMPFGHYQLMYNYNGSIFDCINITGNFEFEEIMDFAPPTIFEMMIGVNF